MGVVFACDLGGTSFRAGLVDEAGLVVAEAVEPGPVPAEREGGSEIDAEAWWQRLLATAGRLHEAAPDAFAQVEAVAVCGITRTQVFLDRAGRPIRPAMTWKDLRAESATKTFASGPAAGHPEGACVNAFHPVARLAWLKAAEPDTFAALASVLEPKDFLNLRLTGRAAGDPVSLARLLAAAAPGPEGTPDLFAAAGLDAAVLPPVLEPWGIVGPVRAGLPAPLDRLAGVPVVCGSNDTWVGVVGLGAMRDGLGYNISGTTEVLGVVGAEPAAAEGLLTVDWRGLHQLGGPSQNGADTVAWLLAVLGREAGDVGAAMESLLAGPRDPQPLLFLPYLQGERVPYWDPSLRGAFVGLNRRHGATDLAHAVLEGIAFQNRVVLERAEEAAGRRVEEIRFGGGAAANAVWRQVKADVTGRAIAVGACREPGILGAAILAWTALGRFGSLAEAQDRLVRIAHRHAPDPARAAVYDRLYGLYRQAEVALAPISRRLAGFATETAARPQMPVVPPEERAAS